MSVKLEQGSWSGEYIDRYGHRGKLNLEIKSDDAEISGEYQLSMKAHHEVRVMKGEVKGKIKGDIASLNFTLGNPDQDKEYGTMECQGTVSDAGSFALQSITGEVTAAKETNFGGGVWIAWKYKSERR